MFNFSWDMLWIQLNSDQDEAVSEWNVQISIKNLEFYVK